MAWLRIRRQKYGLSAEEICEKLREKAGDVDACLVCKGAVYTPAEPRDTAILPPPGPSGFTNAMKRDIESALLSQLDNIGLRLFVDDNGRSGQQYPADGVNNRPDSRIHRFRKEEPGNTQRQIGCPLDYCAPFLQDG